ncbi:SipW-dependent-type signal peptide-containing protein [Saliphagus infecundisoli]|uniref:SipW-dependent-type signal peptide-containing protein n=1 Tax=Saliphagus infecundisoli TaxID=1849069 RepID=A0ABD5QE61_9EURY|nr:SipW-dependent-type signal peptide-containing protein [Saliphagus infecundisoli]
MSEKDFEISRRKALAGVGVVGVASAGAGLGTTAYFSDEETFDGNTITAGEFGMEVKQTVKNVNQGGLGPSQTDFEEGNNDDGVWVTDPITIADAKPGDIYKFCWEVTINHNPGYVAVYADGLSGSDNDLANNLDATVTVDGDDVGNVGTFSDVLSHLDGGQSYWDQIDKGQTVTFCLKLEISTKVGNEIQGQETGWDLIFYAEQARHNDGGPSGSPFDD